MKQTKFPSCTLIELISASQAELQKTDEQLAQELGLEDAHAITLLKAGKIRLSSSQLGALAMSLDIPAAYVLRAALAGMAQDTVAALESLWDYMVITDDENRLVEAYRALANSGGDPVKVTLPGAMAVLIPVPGDSAS